MVCSEIDPEFCIQAGCELARDAENTAPTCTGETPTACELRDAEECEQIRGCSWFGGAS